MKNVIVTGSLAYDRIMNFGDSFANHILPDKIHTLNVCFQVDGVTENYGGTAGNIAYALRLMGETPLISATIGRDHHNYYAWLEKNGLRTDGIKIIDSELTAGAYITTDKTNNQITGFNPGAMKYSSELDIESLDPRETLLLVSPGNLDDMIQYPRRCRRRGISYIFDPGQALPVLPADGLQEVIAGAQMLIVNDYEFNLIQDKTGMRRDQLLALPETTIITLGDRGSQIFTKESEMLIPAFPAAKVIDPTGAGDSYRGGLISGLLSGKSLRDSALQGSACASFAVECNGTQVYSFSPDAFALRLAGPTA